MSIDVHNPNIYGVYDATGVSNAIALTRFKSKGELSEFKSLSLVRVCGQNPNPCRPRNRERGLQIPHLKKVGKSL